MNFTEPPMPPKPEPIPEQRPARLLEYDSTTWSDPTYVNAAYEWAYRVAKREAELGAEVVRWPLLDTTDVVPTEIDYLVLLPAPMIMRDTGTGYEFRTVAFILHADTSDGALVVNGWVYDNHLEAREVFQALIKPDEVEDVDDLVPDPDEDEDEDEDL